MVTHIYKQVRGNQFSNRENVDVIAWTGQQLAEHFKIPNTPAPDEFMPFIRNKTLTVARDHHENIIISIATPAQVGVVHPNDYLFVLEDKLYSRNGRDFELMFAKVEPELPENRPFISREELETQRCTRPNCKQPAKYMFLDRPPRNLPVFRCPQHLIGDISWDALSPDEVESLQKIGE